MAFLNQEQLHNLGLKCIGKNVLISEKASIYGAENICIGNNSRIDDFAIVSASAEGINIGNYVHVSCYTSLIGHAAIKIGDYSNISGRTSIYSSSDDFSGVAMTGPLIHKDYTNVRHAPVIINKHVIIGAGSVVLPGVTLHEGVAIGAMSLVTMDCEAFTINAGIPVRFISKQDKALIQLDLLFLQSTKSNSF